MKKFFFVCFLLLQSGWLFAFEPVKAIKLNIQFDSEPNKPFYDQPLHINKIMMLNPNQLKNNIVMTQSKIINNFPITLAMLVKPAQMTHDAVTLQFNLVHYGFNKGGSIITQPKMTLKNGEEGEMKINNQYTLKVIAQWTQKTPVTPMTT